MNSEELKDDGIIGSFGGYIRRPKPTTSGMIANIFGENGEDADMISALSLTKFQETGVFVEVYLVKDSNGRLMREGESYPMIAKFNSIVRRPQPGQDGMTAQFFAANGEDADEVLNLGKTKYQDAFVFVQIKKNALIFNPDIQMKQQLEQQAAKTVINERKNLQKKIKEYGDAMNALKLSGFFKQPNVWKAIGTEEEYIDYIKNEKCLFHNHQCYDIQAFKMNNEDVRHYAYVPLCIKHAEQAKNDINSIPGGIKCLNMRHSILIYEWAMKKLTDILGYDEPNLYVLNPSKVLFWAIENKLNVYIPTSFKNAVDKIK